MVSPTTISQDKRNATLKTPLGKDKLVLSLFEGDEGLSELFDFVVHGISETANLDFDSLLGKNSSVSIKSGYDGVVRIFNGIVTKAKWIGSAAGMHNYKLTLRPWLWLLTRTRNCRIFSNMTVPEIIDKVFSEYDFAKHETRLTKNYSKLEYCVQYRESDFDFVSRLMEEYGIYYFFEHTEDEHTMILADGLSSHAPKEGGANLAFVANYVSDAVGTVFEDFLHEWVPSRSLRTGKITLNSHDYAKPPTDLLSEIEGGGNYANAKLEKRDFNWRHFEKSLGVDFAQIRLEAEQALDKVFTALGNAVTCFPGALMKLDKHPENTFNQEHLIVSAKHRYKAEDYMSQDAHAQEYEGSYQFQPAEVPYRAPQQTEMPRIHGPQIAVVTDDRVDEIGRIRVKFFWVDGPELSIMAPVSQAWAGSGYGDVRLPRTDMEVVVQFLDGDPDHPVITGCLYSHQNKPPYSLPENRTISGIKTRTYGPSGYNEFILDDKKDAELIRLHAQKNMESRIENDVKVDIGHERTEHIAATWYADSKEAITFRISPTLYEHGPPDSTFFGTPINKAEFDAEMAAPVFDMKPGGIHIGVGTSFIHITAEGVEINSPVITLRGLANVSVDTMLTSINSSASVIVNSALTLVPGTVVLSSPPIIVP